MNRKVFATLAFSAFSLSLLVGCQDQQLANLEVGPDDQVATFKVIDGM